MNLLFGITALLILALTLPFLGRAIAGPTIFDRTVALNGIGTLLPVLMVVIGVTYRRVDMFVDMALALWLLNLFTTLLIARWVRAKAEAEG
jgi:multicomponent Na+:H+ antiporter subunit F